MTINLSVLFALSIFTIGALAVNPRVNVANGEVEGYIVEGTDVHAYEGIRFAEKAERLQYPVKKKDWTGVLEAKMRPPGCLQVTFGPDPPVSEDCLFLSVVAPSQGEKKHPVVVIVHGGAFSVGGIFETNITHVAKHLVSKGVVVVAIQYRVGPLGFCTTGDSVMPGNYGVFDVKMALEWIRDNIGMFGGDPNKVTAYGGSAGAAMIDSLLLNEETNNLFHKMIMFSGASRDLFKQDIKGSCKKFLGEKGLDVSSPEKMRESILAEKDTAKLQSGWHHVYESAIQSFTLDWAPVIDGNFFKADISKQRRNAPKKPMIFGMADLEGAGFTYYFSNKDNVHTWRRNMNILLQYMVPHSPTRDRVMADLLEEYDHFGIEQMRDRDTNYTVNAKVAFDKAFGEYIMGSVVYDEIDYFLKKNGDDPKAPIYLYNFKWYNETFTRPHTDIRGAFHSMDQWHSIFSNKYMNFDSPGDSYARDVYTNIIVNFAKTGDPNGDGPTKLPVYWDKITKERPDRNFVIDHPAKMQEDYFNGRPKRIRDWSIEWGRKTEM